MKFLFKCSLSALFGVILARAIVSQTANVDESKYNRDSDLSQSMDAPTSVERKEDFSFVWRFYDERRAWLKVYRFDPDYAKNGRFYTIHLEDVDPQVNAAPDNSNVPGLNVEGYRPTEPVRTPGEDRHEAVLIEWTDTKPANTTFEGTARELLRIPAGSRFHPMGDLAFIRRRGLAIRTGAFSMWRAATARQGSRRRSSS